MDRWVGRLSFLACRWLGCAEFLAEFGGALLPFGDEGRFAECVELGQEVCDVRCFCGRRWAGVLGGGCVDVLSGGRVAGLGWLRVALLLIGCLVV